MLKLALVICFSFMASLACLWAQEPLPRDWQVQVKAKYDQLTEKVVSFETFLRAETREYRRIQAIRNGRSEGYEPQLSASLCGNGSFESGTIDENEWTGGYGSIDPTTRDPDWPNLSSGLSSGSITSADARQTIVATGTDDNVGISTTHSGGYALRIGNQAIGRQTELVSRTFVVDPDQPIIRFWYAVVLNDPQINHADDERPSFWVRVMKDSDGSIINNVVDLGNPEQPDKIWADADNDFLEHTTVGSRLITYRDWTCAEIDLSDPQLAGQTVTVQFITEDCSQWSHYGYAYLDDFCATSCAGSPDGWLAFDAAASDCEQGLLCFNYGVPDNGAQSGTAQITVSYLQNGALIHSETSPVLNGGADTYCFQFHSCDLPGMDPSADGFDFYATASFTFDNEPLPPKTIGSMPNGYDPGPNNDCACTTGSPGQEFGFDPCCPPMSETFLPTLFQHVPTGNLNDPYQLSFTNDPLFMALSQDYLDYIHSLYPEITKLAFHWRIIEAGDGDTPNEVWSPSPQELWTWFLPDGGGVMHNSEPFFTPVLEVGKWYRIHVGIFTDPEAGAFDVEACFGDMRCYYRARFIGGRLRGEFRNEQNMLQQLQVREKTKR